ncbi:hypothetical protein PLICRDRAFT_34893 [Plicaturopsis crispa FD-325 SS-3]|nr:hypothetical protein PLICRDRAFT_34893 [Plicaturopsis crispa FD-325 SS-3]
MDAHAAQKVATAAHELYTSLGFKPPAGQYTILACFALTSVESNAIKIISLSTGAKCLPLVRFPPHGNALHDSHAEVLARRGAVRWFLEEIGRVVVSGQHSDWISKGVDGLYGFNDRVRLHLYISTVPCGDASMRFLASTQDKEMATLKDSASFPALPPNTASRGRDNYSLYGVLRTKPGRADSPPTICMSCSDKIAKWNVLGIQGALGSQCLSPIYVDGIVIGEVPSEMQDVVREDCERAFYGRIGTLSGLPSGYRIHAQTIQFTDVPFIHSRATLATTEGSCNESLCWIADSASRYEVVINGWKRGVSPKHRHKEKFWPQSSKIRMFNLYDVTMTLLGMQPHASATATYRQAKDSAQAYQAAKRTLIGENRPFAGWVKSGLQWESFNISGDLVQTS